MNARSKEIRALRRHLRDLLSHREALAKAVAALEWAQRQGDAEAHGGVGAPAAPRRARRTRRIDAAAARTQKPAH